MIVIISLDGFLKVMLDMSLKRKQCIKSQIPQNMFILNTEAQRDQIK